MADDQPPRSENKPPQKGRPRGMPMFIIVMGLLVTLLVAVFYMELGGGKTQRLNSSELRAKLEKDQVAEMKLRFPADGNVIEVRGKYQNVPEGETQNFTAEISSKEWDQWLAEHYKDPKKSLLTDVNYSVEPVDDTFGSFLRGIVPFIIVLAIIWFLFLRRGGGPLGGGVMAFGRSKAKMFTKEDVTVTFNDVAGADEAKEEVAEVVEFLRTPQRFTRLGAKIPKGLLLIGPPGCGKTLLAKAIAGEAERPFFSISGSDFVEMFVGVGASRVRDLFRTARENAPCIIFIDEIDAVGRRRGTGVGGGHDEREQTLNALLVEMDGIGTSEGVIILAATNRPDVLDNALLRPGRFDRQVYIDLPDLKGREEILRVHLKKVKHGRDVDAREIARLISGFSGADIMSLVNEAALLAALRNLDEINRDCVMEARDRVAFGRQKRSRVMAEDERRVTAYHEAGHTIVQELTPNTDPVHKVTIIPRGRALGATMSLPEKDRYTMPQKRAEETLMVLLGGRAAEHIVFGEVDAGAASDIQQATNLARKMVTEWGMSPRLGLLNYSGDEDQTYMGQQVIKPGTFSDETRKAIDEEMRRLIDTAWERTLKLLADNREKLVAVAESLLKFETLDHDDIRLILDGGDLEAKRRKEEEEAKAEAAARKHRQLEEQPKERPATGQTGGLSEQPA
ncbi:MAG: ATP-dependent zinc metalloprotease FtsH [Planctomycetes bacterium]|jgi:cell division protease FtsH|nr:ATP-dependent zinc metalloprotease FtsH [Planctomycetota bacterium]